MLRAAFGDRLLTEPATENLPVRLEEIALVASINVRCNLEDERLSRRLAKVMGEAIEVKPNHFVQVADKALIWLGPDELLVTSSYGDRLELIAALESQLHGLHCAITDVTGNRVHWRLFGQGARELLSVGCAIDFHERVFSAGQCVQTLFARSSATILQISADPIYELHVRRSFNVHLQRWMLEAAKSLAEMINS